MSEPPNLDHLRADENSVDRGHHIITLWGQQIDVDKATVEERFGLVWEMTIEEWAKKGIDIRNQPMRKDIGALYKLGTNPPPDWFE